MDTLLYNCRLSIQHTSCKLQKHITAWRCFNTVLNFKWLGHGFWQVVGSLVIDWSFVRNISFSWSVLSARIPCSWTTTACPFQYLYIMKSSSIFLNELIYGKKYWDSQFSTESVCCTYCSTLSFFKVCVANPPEALTSAGCAPAFPPGCDCDPLEDPADSTCSADQECVQCKCLPLGCDCDENNPDPNSFCPAGDICKVTSICKKQWQQARADLGQTHALVQWS